jgi:hypothetical protein
MRCIIWRPSKTLNTNLMTSKSHDTQSQLTNDHLISPNNENI